MIPRFQTLLLSAGCGTTPWWLRVLFSREFHLDDAMLLWDAAFAENAKDAGGVRDFLEVGPGATMHNAVSTSCDVM